MICGAMFLPNPLTLYFCNGIMDTTKYQNGLKHKASRRMKRAAFLSELLRFFYRGHESGEDYDTAVNREVLFPCAGNSLLDSSF